jgi:hypothetical protein
MAATTSQPREGVKRGRLIAFGVAFAAAALLSPILFAYELIVGTVGLIVSLVLVRRYSDAARTAAAIFAGIAAGGLAYALLGLVINLFGASGTGSS